MVSDAQKRAEDSPKSAPGYISELQEFIIENFLFGDPSPLTPDVPLIESGIVDSTGVLELVSFLEERYGIVLEDDEIVPDNFNDIESLSRFLAAKLNDTDH